MNDTSKCNCMCYTECKILSIWQVVENIGITRERKVLFYILYWCNIGVINVKIEIKELSKNMHFSHVKTIHFQIILFK